MRLILTSFSRFLRLIPCFAVPMAGSLQSAHSLTTINIPYTLGDPAHAMAAPKPEKAELWYRLEAMAVYALQKSPSPAQEAEDARQYFQRALHNIFINPEEFSMPMRSLHRYPLGSNLRLVHWWYSACELLFALYGAQNTQQHNHHATRYDAMQAEGITTEDLKKLYTAIRFSPLTSSFFQDDEAFWGTFLQRRSAIEVHPERGFMEEKALGYVLAWMQRTQQVSMVSKDVNSVILNYLLEQDIQRAYARIRAICPCFFDEEWAGEAKNCTHSRRFIAKAYVQKIGDLFGKIFMSEQYIPCIKGACCTKPRVIPATYCGLEVRNSYQNYALEAIISHICTTSCAQLYKDGWRAVHFTRIEQALQEVVKVPEFSTQYQHDPLFGVYLHIATDGLIALKLTQEQAHQLCQL